MDYFQYNEGTLYAENIAVEEIAEAVGTPFYCYSRASLQHHFMELQDALQAAGLDDHLICFAVKSNSNIAVLASLAELGAGADIVSIGEFHRARAAGIAAGKIVFSGVGKTAHEMRSALLAGVGQFNIESLSELEELSHIAQTLEIEATVSLRVNPDIDADTHAKITTGKAENKFGIAWEDAYHAFAKARALSFIKVTGVDIHIGSQITDLTPFRQAFTKLAALVAELNADGHEISELDLGGGLGIAYERDNQPPPDSVAYAQMIAETLGHLNCRILLEPGRMIAGNAGILVTSIIRAKQGQEKNFLIVDAAMTELIRPTLYDAYHHIAPLTQSDAPTKNWDIVGPVCESGDFLGIDRALPDLENGQRLAVFSCGAYAAVQASNYNTRPLAPEVMVKGDEFAIIRHRQNIDDLLECEISPEWTSDD